eukprot:COSAG05_NODE_1442_length_4879_cov_8.264644_6_plen_412_part_00
MVGEEDLDGLRNFLDDFGSDSDDGELPVATVSPSSIGCGPQRHTRRVVDQRLRNTRGCSWTDQVTRRVSVCLSLVPVAVGVGSDAELYGRLEAAVRETDWEERALEWHDAAPPQPSTVGLGFSSEDMYREYSASDVSDSGWLTSPQHAQDELASAGKRLAAVSAAVAASARQQQQQQQQIQQQHQEQHSKMHSTTDIDDPSVATLPEVYGRNGRAKRSLSICCSLLSPAGEEWPGVAAALLRKLWPPTTPHTASSDACTIGAAQPDGSPGISAVRVQVVSNATKLPLRSLPLGLPTLAVTSTEEAVATLATHGICCLLRHKPPSDALPGALHCLGRNTVDQLRRLAARQIARVEAALARKAEEEEEAAAAATGGEAGCAALVLLVATFSLLLSFLPLHAHLSDVFSKSLYT